MDKKNALFLFMTIFIITLSVFLTNSKIVSAMEAQLVKIVPEEKFVPAEKVVAIKIDPQTITINKGTVVLWVNGCPELVKVVFDVP